MYWHEAKYVTIIRGYDEPGGFERRDPPRVVITASYLRPDLVLLSGALGSLGERFKDIRSNIESFRSFLRQRGVWYVIAERSDGRRLPYAEPLDLDRASEVLAGLWVGKV